MHTGKNGIRTVTLNGDGLTPAAAAERLGLPSWAGKNRDALYDALTDICRPTAIFLQNPTATEPVLRRVLQDAAAANSRLWIFTLA